MRFSPLPSPSTATRVAVWTLPLLLSWCVVPGAECRRTDGRSDTSADATVPPTTFGPASRGTPTTVEKPLPAAASGAASVDAPADVTSPHGVTYPPTDDDDDHTNAQTIASEFAEFDFTSEEMVGATGAEETDAGATESRWVQRVSPRPRPPAADRSAKGLRTPASAEYAFKSPGNPLSLSHAIADTLYGPPWPATRTSAECSEDMRAYRVHMQNFTLWAAKMFDATSKGPEGLLDGNIFSFGNFDQCVSTKSKNLNISGGYSLVDINYRPTYELYPGFYNDDHSDDYEPLDEDQSAWKAINHNIQEDYFQRHVFQWAVCLPDTCHYEDVKKIVSDVLIPKMNHHGLEANVTVDPLLHTSRKNIYQHTVGFYLVCAMYLTLTLLVVVGTFYDLAFVYYQPKSEHGPMKKVLKPFSIISNIQRLLKPSESKEFSIINGLKVFCIVQVIPGHRWIIELGNPESTPNYIQWLIHGRSMGYFKCAVFLETFFVISGFLTFHIITKELVEKKRLNFFLVMVYRWLRIIPVYATLIVTYMFALPYLNDGPYWRKLIYRESERCLSNWWTNALFVNNYVHTDELCIIPAWYLACDMHFFVLGVLLTYAIWKWRRIGLIMLGACLTLSTVVPAYIIVTEKHRGIPVISPGNMQDISKDRFFTEVYIKSHMRSLTYFVGIFTGYLYKRLKETNYKFSLRSRAIWTPINIIVINIIYLLSGVFYIVGHQYDPYEHALYFTICRLVWSVIIGYAIIGHGLSSFGVCISGFFGHRIFHVLGKLVFCMYMFQELIQLQTIGSMRTPTYQSMTLIAWRWCGDTLMAIMYAFAINVMVESPFDRLQKNLMKKFFKNEFSKPKSLPTNNTQNLMV